jgi:TPR repeat protein
VLAGRAQAMTAEEGALIRQSAEDGSASAQLLLGLAYLRGDGGLAKDDAIAARWLEKAAVQGNTYAESELGDLYFDGLGVTRNPRLAVDWWEKAARRGNVKAQYKLGKTLLEGRVIPRDPERGRSWLERAAKEGSAEAQFLLGRMYLEGEWVKPDPDAAKSMLERSALNGYESAVKLLHMIESIGYSLEDELHGGQPDLRKLAADGDPEAQYRLGLSLEHGTLDRAKNVPEAVEWYRRAAASGNRRAMLSLARIYEQGADGVAADQAQARTWRSKAGQR